MALVNATNNPYLLAGFALLSPHRLAVSQLAGELLVRLAHVSRALAFGYATT